MYCCSVLYTEFLSVTNDREFSSFFFSNFEFSYPFFLILSNQILFSVLHSLQKNQTKALYMTVSGFFPFRLKCLIYDYIRMKLNWHLFVRKKLTLSFQKMICKFQRRFTNEINCLNCFELNSTER